MADYADRWITCTDKGIRVRGYYLPWGTKVIPYQRIHSVKRVDIGPLTGRARIWGTANPRYWASLDPKRATKKVAYLLDIGRFVQPYLTPDDPDAFEATVRAHSDVAIDSSDRGPIV